MSTITFLIKFVEFNFTEAEVYVGLLQTDGVNNPVDIDVNSYKMQLPEWYDEILFKRLVNCLNTIQFNICHFMQLQQYLLTKCIKLFAHTVFQILIECGCWLLL